MSKVGVSEIMRTHESGLLFWAALIHLRGPHPQESQGSRGSLVPGAQVFSHGVVLSPLPITQMLITSPSVTLCCFELKWTCLCIEKSTEEGRRDVKECYTHRQKVWVCCLSAPSY